MKNRKMFQFLLLTIMVFTLAGCYTPEGTTGIEILPEKFQTIAVPTFTNDTPYYGVNEDLTREVIEKLVQNGRLTVADKNSADCMLEGKIVRYLLVPLSYDENDIVEQKKLKIIVNLTFTDLSNDSVLWEEHWRETSAGTEIGGIIEEVRFFVTSESDENVVETELSARDRIIIELSEEIVRRTIYGW